MTRKQASARQFNVCQIVWSSFKGYLVCRERKQITSHIFSHMTYDPKMWPWRRRKMCDKSFALCVNIVNMYVKFRGIQKRFEHFNHWFLLHLYVVTAESGMNATARYVTWHGIPTNGPLLWCVGFINKKSTYYILWSIIICQTLREFF